MNHTDSTASKPDSKHSRDLELLYADEWLVAIYKPAGLLVHRSEIDRHESVFALQKLRDQLQQSVYTVHRLDKPTSGVLLFALSPEVARDLSTSFSEQTVHKEYEALVRGFVVGEGSIDYAYAQRFDALDPSTHEARVQAAVTRYECLEQYELNVQAGRYPTSRYSRVRLKPQTGRKHQIRRHMKHIFHPLVGDTTYGDGQQNKFFRKRYACQRLMLCATGLEFRHPRDGKVVRVSAMPDVTYTSVIERLVNESILTG